MSADAARLGDDDRLSLRQLLRDRRQEIVVGAVPYVILAVLVAWFGYLIPESLSYEETVLTIEQSLVLVMLAVGQSFVLLSGGIDLSVGGVVSVTNCICAVTMTSSTRAWLIAPLLLALGWVPGLINGLLVAYLGLQPFIATLGTWFVLAGIAFYVLETAGGFIDLGFEQLTAGAVLGVDTALIVLAVIALLGMWLLRTRVGLEIRAVGADETAAALAGIPTRRALLVAYSLSSMFAVAGGIVLSAQSLSGDPTVGDKYLLLSVAAAVIGGTSLFGGQATVIGSIVGAIALGYVARVTFAQGLASEWGLIFSGLLLALAVALQGGARRLAGSRG